MSTSVPLNVTIVEDVSSLDLASSYAEVMEAAFGESTARWFDVYKCKHEQNPFGGSYAGLIFDAGRLVAMNFFCKWQFVRGNDVVCAVQSCDLAVRPAYQGQGLFPAIQRAAMERIPPDVIRYGFPNANSSPGFRRLGWIFFDSYCRYLLAVDVRRFVLQRVIRRDHAFRSRVRECHSGSHFVDARLDTFLDDVKGESDVWMTNYSRELIEWRLRLNRAVRTEMFADDSRIVGFLIYSLSELVADPTYCMLSIIDLICDSSAGAPAAVRQQLQALVERHGVSEIQSATTRPFEELAKLGWRVRRKPIPFKIHPAYGWKGHSSIEAFVATARVTSFASDHV